MRLEGKRVCGGIAIGKLSVYRKEDSPVRCAKADDTEAELERFTKARDMAERQLAAIREKAQRQAGAAGAAIFEVHQMMLKDPEYTDAVTGMISSGGVNAEYAVEAVGEHFAEVFAAMDEAYMRERAADVKDISSRVNAVLRGTVRRQPEEKGPVILLADDLAPGETVQLDKSLVLSFVTRRGSTGSHTAILARAMNIPALAGVDFPEGGEEDPEGKTGIVDGYGGVLYIDPDGETLKKFKRLQKEEEEQTRLLQEMRGKENITPDGRKIDLCANISGVEDVEDAIAGDAGGIGLFRSEFLYLESAGYPDEETQFAAYRTVAEKMKGKRVVIRTMDIGADKQADYFGIGKEANPAMGYRAIRICLDRRELFKTQLRAIYRAGIYGAVAVMFPMIISMTEIRQIKAIIAEVKAELEREGIPYGKDIKTGIMIETPAAVMISDQLAEEVDFFSVGTNDLTQYTLAIDRQNPMLDHIYDPHHEAVLRMIRIAVENGHKRGCRVGICGELAADITMTETFLRMGVDELSVAPSMILKVREKIRNTDLSAGRDGMAGAAE